LNNLVWGTYRFIIPNQCRPKNQACLGRRADGILASKGQREVDGSVAAMDRALDSDPHDGLAAALGRLGRAVMGVKA
jgi:hypothetical protein